MTFGFSTLADLLSWTAMLLLGLKLLATVVLLPRDRKTWFQARWSAGLWWASKITPVLAVPCIIAVGLLRHDDQLVWVFSAMMVFVVIAVPLKIWLRFGRRRGDGVQPAASAPVGSIRDRHDER